MLREKRWDRSFEEEILEGWKNRKCEIKGKKIFSIDTPPPYVNTPIHVGHAATYVLMDMFARYRRSKDYDVLFPLGLDRNGLPIEMEAEKRFKTKLTDLSREEALERCRMILRESSDVSKNTFFSLGISFSSYVPGEEVGSMYYTDSESYRKLTQSTFIDLWNRGLIYEDKRINNYCPGCGTTIADAEIQYEEKRTLFNELIFRIKETGEEIVVGTTRPELLCTCATICFNPEDERYKRFEGKTALVPLYGNEVKIIAHPMAKADVGTGLVMMCSFGDLNDVRFFREQAIEPKIAIGIEGRMNGNSGFLEGLRVREAREKMVEKLDNEGFLRNKKEIMHPVPICERSRDDVEFIEMDELYLRQLDFKEDMLKMANEIEFYDGSSRKILIDWINSLTMDWPISRRRYYGTEIPLWYCRDCGETLVPEQGNYYRPWKEDPPQERCPRCGGSSFEGEGRVFDTWFDSSSSVLYMLGYERDQSFFSTGFPCSLRPQGKEIIRSWLYYTLLKTYLLTGKKAFKDVWINYHVVDDNGKKMSKSKGNVIDPNKILEKYGAEPFRLWCALEGDLTKDDFRCSFERIEGTKKTLTKLWNVSRFITSSACEDCNPICDLDRAIIIEMNGLIDRCDSSYERYNFHDPAVEIREFIWEKLGSNYLESVKSRVYNDEKIFNDDEQRSGIATLYRVLKALLRLLRPITPFITEKIYGEIWGDGGLDTFPDRIEVDGIPFGFNELMELNHSVWKGKKDRGLSLREGVKKIVIDGRFRGAETDIKQTHHAETVEYGEKIGIEF